MKLDPRQIGEGSLFSSCPHIPRLQWRDHHDVALLEIGTDIEGLPETGQKEFPPKEKLPGT
ncbi:MAG: hypothetical protein N2V78_07165 [Methanophagales archaeon]|nr:hypothetical protein [Methanophagales archaeon]MCW3142228.1 hypothetical protein [Methanophagales archaeon]